MCLGSWYKKLHILKKMFVEYCKNMLHNVLEKIKQLKYCGHGGYEI